MKLPPKPTAALLEHQDFFKGTPWRPLEKLAALASYAHFVDGQVIFCESAAADRFHLILSGRVALQTTTPDQRPVTVQILEAGEALGWSWMFPPHQWSFTARALEPVAAIAFDAPKLRLACEEDHALGHAVMKRVLSVMLNRLQATRRRLAALEHAAAGLPLKVQVMSYPPGGNTPL